MVLKLKTGLVLEEKKMNKQVKKKGNFRSYLKGFQAQYWKQFLHKAMVGPMVLLDNWFS